MADGVNLKNLTVVLHKPRSPENIGAAARAMCNMGIRDLIVVDPHNCDLTRILKMATHAAVEVVEQMGVFDKLSEALAPYHFIVGTTARLGRQRQVLASPALLAVELIPISQNNRIALLFGPEDRGLSNADLRLCHRLVNISTSSFTSINLAQAVMILCYAMHTAGAAVENGFIPRLAARHELDGMYAQVKEILIRIDYIKPDNPDYWMNSIRHFFTRLGLQAREVSVIRGICRQIDWYGRKSYEDGKKDAGHGVPPGRIDPGR